MNTKINVINTITTTINGIGNDIVGISAISIDSIALKITDLGKQGMPGAQGIPGPKGDIGDTLEFQALTEEQKIELRGDVGDTSTNYTNLFNSVLLS